MYNNVLGPNVSNNEELTVNNNAVNDVSKTNEIECNKNPKKKGKVVLIVILALLLMGVMCYGGWKLGRMYANHENNKEVKEENSSEKLNDQVKNDEYIIKEKKKDYEIISLRKNNKYTFYTETKKNISFNGKDHEIITYYYSDLENTGTDCDFNENVMMYRIRAEIFMDGKLIVDAYEVLEMAEFDKDFVKNLEDYKYEILKDSVSSEEYLIFYLQEGSFVDGCVIDSGGDEAAYVIDSDAIVHDALAVQYGGTTFSYILVNEDMLSDHPFKKIDSDEDGEDYDQFGNEIEGSHRIFVNNGTLDVHDSYFYHLDHIWGKDGLVLIYKMYFKDGEYVSELYETYPSERVSYAGQD